MPRINQNNTVGFTLVELIVVISILAILATIAFLSFNSQSSYARDSRRIADISNISKGLSVFSAKAGKYPMPDDYITINAGTGFALYQGIVGGGVLGNIMMSDIKKESLDSDYSYSIDGAKVHFTLGGFLENPLISLRNIFSPLSSLNATDPTKHMTLKGDFVGIITESGAVGTNTLEQSNPSGITIDLVDTSKNLILNISNANIISGTGQMLGIIQTLQNGKYNFSAPNECPTGFIPVLGNAEFNQPGFCVAKYEMKAVGGVAGPSANGVTYNTHDYNASDIIISNATDLPIATIKQTQAITACKSLGSGYHLITNNEWMTIARNIEDNSINWIGNTVGSGYIYSGHNDNSPANAIAASIDDSDGYINSGDLNGNQKRTLTLSNGQIIWDLAGNVWEHVNKANTMDIANISSNVFSVESACNNGAWAYWSWAGNDGKVECLYKNGYSRATYGPKGYYNAINGIGRIYATNAEDRSNIFRRGGSWDNTLDAGVFALALPSDVNSTSSSVGFRCAK